MCIAHATSSVDKSTTICWSDTNQKTIHPSIFHSLLGLGLSCTGICDRSRRDNSFAPSSTAASGEHDPHGHNPERKWYHVYKLPEYKIQTTQLKLGWLLFEFCKWAWHGVWINHLATGSWPDTKRRVLWQQRGRPSSEQGELGSAHTTRRLQASRAPCHTLLGVGRVRGEGAYLVQEVYTMVELRLSLLTAGNGQRVSTYQALENDKGQVFLERKFWNAHADGPPIKHQCTAVQLHCWLNGKISRRLQIG